MHPTAEKFIQNKSIALLGASRSGNKFGNLALNELKQRGFQVFVVHPTAAEIDGERCYPSLAALQGKTDAALLVIPPAQVAQALREVSAAGMHYAWLQQGAETPEALRLGDELGLQVVSGRCILMYAGHVGSYHAFHRFFNKLIGQY
jgi:hypothetical protein